VIGRERTIATTAHAADFADAGHLTRTFYQRRITTTRFSPRMPASGIWTAVHVTRFACMASFLAGLFALFFALDVQAGTARWAGRFGGAASAAVTLAHYGGVLAVDGVALKQAVNAWASAPEAEKAPRFATAEAIRWLGMGDEEL